MRMIVPKGSFSTSVTSRSTSTPTIRKTISSSSSSSSSPSSCDPPPPPPSIFGKTKTRGHGGAAATVSVAAGGTGNNHNPFTCMRRSKLVPNNNNNNNNKIKNNLYGVGGGSSPSLSSHFQRQRYQQQQHPNQQDQGHSQKPLPGRHSRSSENNKNPSNTMRLYNAQSCTPMATHSHNYGTTNSSNNNNNNNNKAAAVAALSSRPPVIRGGLRLPPPPPPPPPPGAPVKKGKSSPYLDLSSSASSRENALLAVTLANSNSTDESGKWSSSPMINNSNSQDTTSWDHGRHSFLSKRGVDKQVAPESVSQHGSSITSTTKTTINSKRMAEFPKRHATTLLVSSSWLSSATSSGVKNAALGNSDSSSDDGGSGKKGKGSNVVSKTSRSDTSTMLSSSFSSSETSDDKETTNTDKNKIATTVSPDNIVPLNQKTEGATLQKWQGGRGFHYAAPQNDRHNLEAAPRTKGEEPHHTMYGKTMVKSKFGIYSNSKEEETRMSPADKNETNGTNSGTGQLLQVSKNEAEAATATTNTKAPQDDNEKEDVSSASNESENGDDDCMHILNYYSSSSGSSSFHFDIDVVKNNHSYDEECQRRDGDAAGADNHAAILMTGEQASCFLSKSTSSTITTLPPTPLHQPESRNPLNEPRESGNQDRVQSFLQKQRQLPPGRSPFSPPPASPSEFEAYNGNRFSEDETDYINFLAPTKVERQKVSSTDPFWTVKEDHPSAAELSSQVYNKRSVDTGDDKPPSRSVFDSARSVDTGDDQPPSRSVFDSAWSGGMQWSASDEDGSWIDFTTDPFQGQAMRLHIRKPSPTKLQATGAHIDGKTTMAPLSTKTLSSSPDAYAFNTQDGTTWNPSLHGFTSRDSTNPSTTGSAFALFKQPNIPHSSSNPFTSSSQSKQREAEEPVVQPDDKETRQGSVVQSSIHSSIARPKATSRNGSSGTGQTFTHPLLARPNSIHDDGRQSDPIIDKYEQHKEQQRRGPLLLGPLLEARYRSLRNAGSHEETVGNRLSVMSRNGARWVAPVARKTSRIHDESSLTTSSLLLRESILSKATYDTGLLSTFRDHEDSQESPLDDTLSHLPERYRKMIQIGLPADAIHNAMRQDGVPPPALLPSTQDTGDFPRPHEMADPCRRFRINWDTHGNVQNTLWAMVARDELWMKETIEIDEDEFTSLFQHQQDPLVPSRLDGMTAFASIIEPKRANNGDTILAKVALSYREIARAINNYDYEVLSLDQIRNLLPYLPAPHEVFKLRDHIAKAGGRHLLKSECEKFMSEMLYVEKAKEKLHVMLFMKRFPLALEDMKNNTRLIQKASDEIMSSSRLRRVLGVILHLGNKINKAGPTGTSKAAAAAIRLQSLANLGNSKALDRKTSFLNYTAAILRKSNPDLIRFSDDLPNLPRAEKVNWDELQEEGECLEMILSNIRELALNVPFADHTSTPILSRDEEIGILQSTCIGRFTLDARIQMAVVNHEREACKQTMEALLTYFGERNPDGSVSGEAGPQTVLHTLAMFAKNFESAVEQSVAREKERSIRDCRAAASVISSSIIHCDKARQRGVMSSLEQIRDVVGAIRCKTMSAEE